MNEPKVQNLSLATEVKFWEKVYVAAVRAGSLDPNSAANYAVRNRRRFVEENR